MFDKKLYQETFSSLHASEDVLVEVMNMTHKTRKHAKLSRTIALAAAVAGADMIDSCINGRGQRAGNTDTVQIIMGLKAFSHLETALSVIFNFSANCACVKPFSFLQPAINFPVSI